MACQEGIPWERVAAAREGAVDSRCSHHVWAVEAALLVLAEDAVVRFLPV